MTPSTGAVVLAGVARRGSAVTGWVRSRRRLVAAVLLALAAAGAVDALAPRPEAGVPVTTSATDLAAGAVLGPGDLQVVEVPESLVPDGAAQPGTVLGRTLASPVRAGELLTDARLLGAGLLAGLPAGTVAVPVRPSDPAVAALLRPGDRVRVVAGPPATDLALPGATAAPAVLTPSATVLAVPQAREAGFLGSPESALLVLAVGAREGTDLATVGDGRWLSVVLLP